MGIKNRWNFFDFGFVVELLKKTNIKLTLY